MAETTEIKKQTRSRSLTVTLTIAFITLSLFTLLVVTLLQLYFSIRAQQEIVAGRQRLLAQDAANQVASFIQTRFGELESAVKFSGLINASPAAAEQTLGQLLGQEPVFRQLAYINPQGEVVAQASRLSQVAANEVAKRLEAGALAQTGQGENYISPVNIDNETFEPLVVMAVPVLDVFGDNQGTLVAEVNLKFMWDLVDRLEIGNEGVAYVVDRQGNLLALEGDISRVLAGEKLTYLQEVAKFTSREEAEEELNETGVTATTGIEGQTVLSTYAPLNTPDWAVVTELPVTEAYQTIWENVIIFGGIAIIVAVLAAGVGVFMARRLAAPVQHLTETARLISDGDITRQAQPEGPTEIRQLAGTFNQMTGQLNDLIQSLEERVLARTQRLEIVATVSEQLVAILNLDQLLNELVNQVKDNFNYYHAHVYILNRESQKLVMTAGAGEAGLRMKARGHSIDLDAPTSLVARAARTGQIVRVDNVREASDWLPNPLLTDTYSEMAVPIVLQEGVAGVLDVQQNTIGGLDESDASLLRSLANQVAVAIRNARLFTEAETALAEARAAQKRYVSQSWEKRRGSQTGREQMYIKPGVPALPDKAQLEAKQQALAQSQPAIVTLNSETAASKAIVAPVTLADQTIGVLQLHQIGSDNESHPWREEDLNLVAAVLDQVAQTAENLRLFDETRERASREAAIREITDKLRAAPNLDRLLEVAARELGQRLGVRHTVMELGIENFSEDNGAVNQKIKETNG